MARRPRLRLISSKALSALPLRAAKPEVERPIIRRAGLFSEVQMPDIVDDAISDPDTFFTLPDTISRLAEEINFGNTASLSEKTGLSCDELNALLASIEIGDALKLKKVRIALGVNTGRTLR